MIVLAVDVLKEPAIIEREIFGEKTELIVANATSNSEIKDSVWNTCDAIMAYDQLVFDKDCIDKLHNCKVIVRVGVGYDNVDLSYAAQKNIIVCNIPDYGTEEVADHTLALLLYTSRGISKYSNEIINKGWDRFNDLPFRLRGKTIGIIGLGRIGSATAIRCKAFGLKVLFYDPYVNDGQDKVFGIERLDSLIDLANKSDIVSIHTPLNRETEGILNSDFFNEMKSRSILINTARGGLINLSDLYKAMKNDKILGCGLDVLPIEPNKNSQPLINAFEKQEDWIKNRLIVTPHVAFYSPESYEEMRTSAAIEVKRVLEDSKPRNKVN